MFARQLAAAHHGNDCCDVVALMAARRHLFDGSDRHRDSYGRGGYGSVSLLPHIWGASTRVILFHFPPESYFSTFHQSHTFTLRALSEGHQDKMSPPDLAWISWHKSWGASKNGRLGDIKVMEHLKIVNKKTEMVIFMIKLLLLLCKSLFRVHFVSKTNLHKYTSTL